ncbi:DUF2975 domain-containing protein [Peptostreptococcus faecalis]|uniref:DUF2975 domain-containing protein n=1 Tax=Peptostreptococcus faecalis TaxID=2045015 RepID=UPI0015E0C053|nr:DUF2975 domain-containing protein [Peptostreptococcus faecalis]
MLKRKVSLKRSEFNLMSIVNSFLSLVLILCIMVFIFTSIYHIESFFPHIGSPTTLKKYIHPHFTEAVFLTTCSIIFFCFIRLFYLLKNNPFNKKIVKYFSIISLCFMILASTEVYIFSVVFRNSEKIFLNILDLNFTVTSVMYFSLVIIFSYLAQFFKESISIKNESDLTI